MLSPCVRSQVRAGSAASYSGISVEPNEQIFATMCALDAAGFDADQSTLGELPGRLALRTEMLKLQGPATSALREFYRNHELADPGETLSRYVALALVVGSPPQFTYQVPRDLLPPDVLSLDGFQSVLTAFYTEANIESRWRQMQSEHESAVDVYQAAVARIVTFSNGYLREVVKPAGPRTFAVYVEPLIGDRTIARNTGDRYAIVVGNTSAVPIDDIRHAYLHFSLDQLVLKNRPAVETKKALLSIAAGAPNLPVEYRDDFLALADECFIKAVELRLRHVPSDKLDAALAEDDATGFILVRPFVQQLRKFEKADPSMSYYFEDLIAGIDVVAEQKRLQNVAFTASKKEPAASPDKPVAPGQTPDINRLLDQGEREIALQDPVAARATFEKALQLSPDHPRALYGLAIASVLSGNAPEAKELFEKIVAKAPAKTSTSDANIEPSLLSWSHIYLGRIHDLEGDRGAAMGEYRLALAVNGAPETARVAAQRGIDAAYSPKPDPNGAETQKP